MTIKERMEEFKTVFNVHFENEIKSILKEQRDFHPVATELDEPLKDIILKYTSGGKRVRPFLISLFADKDLHNLDVLNLCLASELFHLAAIIHDDIMDESIIRRNTPTIHTATQKFANHNKRLGNDIALLLGDVFLTASIKKAALLPTEIFNEFTTMIQRTIRGQYLDSFGMNQELGTTPESEIYARNDLKTAWYTFTSPARFGCMMNKSHTNEMLDIITPIVRELGLLFQIRDDIIDCIDETSGKPLFGDIFENQTTWVILYIKEHYPEKFTEIVTAKKSKDTELLKNIFADIDLHTPYQAEFEKRAEMIENINLNYLNLQDKAREVLGLLELK